LRALLSFPTRRSSDLRTRPPLAPSLNIRALEAMVFSLFKLEGNDAFKHHPVELSTVLDVRIRITEVLLVHILGLRQYVRRNEPRSEEHTSELQSLRHL